MDEIMQLIFQAQADFERGHNNSDSGDTVQQVMDNIRTKSYEISALFDQCGRKIYEHTSHHHAYDVAAVPLAYYPHLFLSVHNHPAGSPFSDGDLQTTMNLDLGVVIVTTASHNYILLRPSAGWPASNEWIKEYRDITRLLRRHPHYDYDVATARHLALMKVAAHYHIWYYVTDLNCKVIASTAP